jgi:hypothetical protein
MPQFELSPWVFVQMPLQFVRPDWQESWQLPAEQTSPVGQSRPHAPQFCRSVCVLTQVPLQFVSPA